MNKYKFIRLAAFLVFAAAFCIWGYTELLYLDADVTYKDLQKKTVTAAETENNDNKTENAADGSENEPMLEVDHDSLLDVNHDYICWLSACGEQVSYPVVRGRDNSEYLHHTFFGDKSFVGSIFEDYRCSAALGDFHTLLYGHSMKDRTMFRLIADYTDKSMAEKYPYFYIYTPNGRASYKIFSVYDVYDTGLMTALGSPSFEEREAFIKKTAEASLYDFSQLPTAEDNIVSLITCDVRDDRKRVVVNGFKAADSMN